MQPEQPSAIPLSQGSQPPADAAALLARTAELSRFARRLLEHLPELFDPQSLFAPCDRNRILGLLGGDMLPDEAALHRRLRRVRQAVMLQLIARDLNGLAQIDEVFAAVTALAEECLRFALRHIEGWAEAAFGAPISAATGEPLSLVVVGMGKLGGAELNVSSDIDLIFLYAEDGETSGPRRVSNQEYFTRSVRRLITALAELTADGQVFRVDTRLRPDGDSGPLTVSFDGLETYLHAHGREWERYAWVKARVISPAPDPELDSIVSSFVYRRHLDYSAIESLRVLHAQIAAEVSRRDLHDNIKLGPGGIREIEFVTQVFQMVRGGRDWSLRERSTLKALKQLDHRGVLPVQAVEDLRTAYCFLRNLEHRLQYLDDQQTHQLPAKAEDRALIAQAMDMPGFDALMCELDAHRSRVTAQFEAVFAAEGAPQKEHPLAVLWRGTANPEDAIAALGKLGFADPALIIERLRLLREGQMYRRMAGATQARVDRLAPRVIEVAAEFDNPDATLERLTRVLESIGRRESYFALLIEYPAALKRLAGLAAASPWATDYLARHPMLLDELISPHAFDAPDWVALGKQLADELDQHSDNTERQMDTLRHFKQVQTLRLLHQDLAGTLPLEKLSDNLSDLAGVILGEVLRWAWAGVRTRHRDVPRFSIVGYGKLGGKELGYASDLDLIFLYDDDHADAAENYGRLAQRINTWLNNFTGAGMLYETDLRLRPDGASGLLVSQFAAFADYQKTKAWTFEHQALTRARFLAGDSEIGARFERLRIDLLCMPRDLAKLRRDVQEMRKKMLDGHPNKSALFDVKHDSGGIVDVEFAVQYLVLGYAHRHPELTANIGNLALLMLAGRLQLIAEDVAAQAHDSYRELRRLQHQLRLQSEGYARVSAEIAAPLVGPVRALWTAVLGTE